MMALYFLKKKTYFKPDYQINLKREMVECTENPSIYVGYLLKKYEVAKILMS